MADRDSLPATLAILGVSLTILVGTACSRSKTLYSVHAQVFFEGQPATGALVVLHPVDDDSPAAIRPSGYVDSSGDVKLTSYTAASRSTGEGAPAGEYIVTIAWLPTDVKEHLSKRPNSELPDKLQGRYGQPGRSSLRAKVLPQPTELPRIDLKKEGATLSVSKHPVSRLWLAPTYLQACPLRGGSRHV